MIMVTSNLSRKVFIEPLENGADHLYIVSGYATPTMATWVMNLAKSLGKKISISLLIGMAGLNGIPNSTHEGFKSLMKRPFPDGVESFVCSYICNGPPVHTKLYFWTASGNPTIAFAGSANFTQTAFSHKQKELLVECDPNQAIDYYSSLLGDSIYCNHAEVEEEITIIPPAEIESGNTESVSLPLLTKRTGDVGAVSGLNWGQRAGRNKNQAYIPVPSYVARSGFFPLNETVFTVLTDDHKQLLVRIEQKNNKALTTPLSNALIGEYFRNRLGVAEGAKVTKADLIRYGRTDVSFLKIEDELFYMDFSV